MNIFCCFVAGLAVIVCGICAAGDQQTEGVPSATSPTSSAGPGERTLYMARHASARDLVPFLEQHFADTGIKFIVVPDSNLISIRAPSAALMEEVLKVVSSIDRPQRQIAFQVFVVEFTTPKAKEGAEKAAKFPFELDELRGTVEAVRLKFRIWAQDGHIETIRTYQLTTFENQLGEVFLGEQRPRTTGYTMSGTTGVTTPTIRMEQTGIQIQLRPHITETGEISVDVNMMETQVEPAEKGVELANGRNGPIVVRGTETTRMHTSVTIPNGNASALSGWQVQPKSNHVPSIVVAAARIVDPKSETVPTPAASPSPQVPATATPRAAGFRAPTTLLRALRDATFNEELKLTVEQRQKMDQLQSEFRDAIRLRLRDDPSKLREIDAELNQKAVDLLTDEQKKVWEKFKSDSDANPTAPRFAPPVPPRRNPTPSQQQS